MKHLGILLSASVLIFSQAASAHDHAKDHQHAPVLPQDVSLAEPANAAELGNVALEAPVAGAQVTSTFGWRRNPVLKYVRFHAGIDYGAPVGTEVMAAGDGVVEKITRADDRGLYVVIRHSDRLTTAYSHLSALQPGLAVGQHVDMHQLIARVGRSGRASGPHLDFETFVDGLRVDPGMMLARASAPAGNHEETKIVALVSFDD